MAEQPKKLTAPVAKKDKVPAKAPAKGKSKAERDKSDVQEALEEGKCLIESKPTNWDLTLSTGSTLLDLAISGGRKEGGGIPGGKMIEVYGPEATGKTAILAEVVASTQHKRLRGDAQFQDPEARLDAEYSRIYGVELEKGRYYRPDKAEEMFDLIEEFNPDPEEYPGINVVAADSLAALSTDLEMDNDEGDKMGMRRAKVFSERLRKLARVIGEPNRLLICSNQIREGTTSTPGAQTPGGKAIRYYASVRMEMRHAYPRWKVERSKKLASGKEVKKVIGVITTVSIQKSSVDDPFREAPVYIVFGYGVDDIRANLQWLKDMLKENSYTGAGIIKDTKTMEDAITRIEEGELEIKLRDEVISLWNEIEDSFDTDRNRKKR